jgi:DNA-binding PadR family transcriptional regulator
MTAAEPVAGDLRCRFAGGFPRAGSLPGCASGWLGQIQSAVRWLLTGRGTGGRGGPWEWGLGHPKGRWDWRGNEAGWWPGPPGFSRGPKAGRGDVRAAILALLQEGPRNGYQIMSEIEERSGGAWRPSPGAVYPALQQLADEGLIEAEEASGRRSFSLTDAGRRYIEENPQRARAAWESMTSGEPGEVPGLFVQAARLGGSIVQVARDGTADQVHAAEALLEQTRRAMYQILAGQDGEQDEQ